MLEDADAGVSRPKIDSDGRSLRHGVVTDVGDRVRGTTDRTGVSKINVLRSTPEQG